MKKSTWFFLALLLACATSCGVFKRLPPAPKQYGPYLLVPEDPQRRSRSNPTPISPREVLLFPVTHERLSSGNWLVSLGHPVLYHHMTDVMDVTFRGIGGSATNAATFLVWARDYYPQLIANQFMPAAIYEGRSYPIQILTPLLPGTDRRKMAEAVMSELRKGEIEVEKPFRITGEINYGRLIKPMWLYSWMTSNGSSNDRRMLLVWPYSPGSKVRVLLDDQDYRLMRHYLLEN